MFYKGHHAYQLTEVKINKFIFKQEMVPYVCPYILYNSLSGNQTSSVKANLKKKISFEKEFKGWELWV